VLSGKNFALDSRKMENQTHSDLNLVKRVKKGDPASFELLYRSHKRRVYSLCLRMAGDPAIAEELTQEAFLLVFRRISTFRGDSAFSTWLHRLTVNVALMYLRHQKSRGPETSLDAMESYDGDEPREVFGAPDPALLKSVDRIALTNAINELPPGYRVILVLHDIEGYEHNEIAELLGCSVGNTKSQLHKARLKLRRLLAEPAMGVPAARKRKQSSPMLARVA
jgi:RNA polymerase sigma-70 factor (ECF subfamily)